MGRRRGAGTGTLLMGGFLRGGGLTAFSFLGKVLAEQEAIRLRCPLLNLPAWKCVQKQVSLKEG
jgi:hypothetical protein